MNEEQMQCGHGKEICPNCIDKHMRIEALESAIRAHKDEILGMADAPCEEDVELWEVLEGEE